MVDEIKTPLKTWVRSLTDDELFEVTIYADTQSEEFKAAQVEYWDRRTRP